MANTNTVNVTETVNYITKGVGYLALLAAIVEQARHDAAKGDADAEKGIEEWAEIFEQDANFNLYEQVKTGGCVVCISLFFIIQIQYRTLIFNYNYNIMYLVLYIGYSTGHAIFKNQCAVLY